ncbi:type II toxin-antitoxin system RelE/ParE family toxin [Algoriphagus yeomjeoni]|uniref:type II toxin-antitoxin system RelE/ParE family toxin n=1 Tax=Algoriphagus yeomjeoni TaxID=291403 RepID=UPI003CE58448
MNYLLSQKAEEDVIRIYRFGFSKFGENQPNKYYDALFICFERIGKSPSQFPEASHIRESYRYCVCGADTIYFKLRSDGLPEIIRIIGRQEF